MHHDEHVDDGPTAHASQEWRCLTVIEAARYLAISRSALYLLLDRGHLASLRIGRSRRIPLAELERFVRTGATAHQ